MKPVCIVTPYYKDHFDAVSRIGFEQCKKILGSYDWYFVVPAGLNTDYIKQEAPNVRIVEFPAGLFISKRTCQYLYMMPEFFQQFQNYTFMLIHELDAYVFRDELMKWVEKNYDFVGAPWLNAEWIKSSHRWYAKIPWHWLFRSKVGNGGLSLWKTSVFLKYSRVLNPIARKLRFLSQDIFWCHLAPALGARITRPNHRVAARFAIETQPQKCFSLNNRVLPFGCHAWSVYDPGFWSDKIQGASLKSDELTK